jgi:hypothetical protein
MKVFKETALTNRLGQALTLPVSVIRQAGREMVFVITPANIPNFLTKNAETIVFQLRELFGLDQKKFELFEVKKDEVELRIWRWRFDWVGSSPLQQNHELVTSDNQRSFLINLLENDSHAGMSA